MLDVLGSANSQTHIDLQSKITELNQENGGLQSAVESADNDLSGESGGNGGGFNAYENQEPTQPDLKAEGKGLVLDISA